MSTSTEYMDGLNASVERRFYPRVTPPTPIYVAFGSNNLGVLHNVSENGLQVKTPGGLPLNSVFRVFLSLNGAPKTITVTVRTVWTDETEKRSGIQLLDLAEEDRAQIRRWVEFEMSRGENATAWRRPESADRRVPKLDPVDRVPVAGRQDLGVSGAGVVAPMPSAPSALSESSYNQPLSNAEQRRSGRRFNGAFVPKDRIASEPLPDEVAAFASAAGDVTESSQASNQDDSKKNGVRASQAASRTPSASAPSAPAPAVGAPSVPPAEEADLPKIANPFDHPDPNVEFNSPFAKVPLPIHGEFEYAPQPAKVRRRPTVSSRLRAKPLVVWAAVLALVCFGANALVKYKIKRNSQRYATESARYTPPKSDASTPDSTAPVEDSGASAATPSSADATSSENQPAAAAPLSPTSSASGLQSDAPTTANPPARSAAKSAGAAQQGTRQESSLDARDSDAYPATAPPASDRSQYSARTTQPAATPRTWSAPAPSQSASSRVSSADSPQSPIVTTSSDNAPAQSAPIVSQTRPTPPPAPVQAPSANNSSPNSVTTASSSNSAANNAASNQSARTQQQPSATQTQTYAANTTPANSTPSRSQSQIYNANTSQQRSAVMGSINSVHSSGIFDSNDAKAASSAPPSGSRSNNASPNASANVANSSVVPTDLPQERDIEIPAPKGFKDSYVEVPGEHVVRTTTATIRIRRLVRVPGEKIPGQRWLWRGKFDVSLGDVVNRIDPSVVQASGASGSLTVQATIDKDGYVTDIKPINGNFAMLPSVSRTVRNWHYDPTYIDSKRAETQAQIEFDVRPTTASSRTTQR